MAKRGRPPLSPGESTARLTLVLPAGMYDRIYLEAQASRVNVPEMIRRVLNREFRNTKSTPEKSSLTL